MRVLVLGGTRFVGRHLVAEALRRGHEVTLFHRGRTRPDPFPQAEHIHGDRDGGLESLRSGTWDAVIDVSGYVPRLVRASAELLAERAGRYLFISTLAVYADPRAPGKGEDFPLARPKDPGVEEVTANTYGPLKVLCEMVVREVYGERGLILRPGYIVGPYDHTDRLTAWVRRVGQGGEMLAPGDPEAPLQFIDARDLAVFALDRLEAGDGGVYNVTGPAEPLTWGRFLDACRSALGAETAFIWVSEECLVRHGLGSQEVPLWLTREYRGVMQADNSKALAAGLKFRPLEETIRDIAEWDAREGEPQLGLPPERERELLDRWRAEGARQRQAGG